MALTFTSTAKSHLSVTFGPALTLTWDMTLIAPPGTVWECSKWKACDHKSLPWRTDSNPFS
eukprot:scaffold79118_cov35-Attheya_sp.AAC.1